MITNDAQIHSQSKQWRDISTYPLFTSPHYGKMLAKRVYTHAHKSTMCWNNTASNHSPSFLKHPFEYVKYLFHKSNEEKKPSNSSSIVRTQRQMSTAYLTTLNKLRKSDWWLLEYVKRILTNQAKNSFFIRFF